MDPRLLAYYNRELQFMREMGGEFAREFPKIAGRLSLDEFECADPYVERLLEGFSFLAARVQLKVDAEFPKFSQHLLEMLYPNYLSPMPSMAVVELQPDLKEGSLGDGFVIPRDSPMRSVLGSGDQTACEFRTAQDATLWPIELVEAEYVSYFQDLTSAPQLDLTKVKAGIRFKLRATAGLTFDRIRLDTLRIFLRGRDQKPVRLYEQLVANQIATVIRPVERPAPWMEVVPGDQITQVGFSEGESLLDYADRSFDGYRLLEEYFAFPERFLFVDLGGLSRGIRRCPASEIEITVLFDRSERTLENAIDVSDFALHCVPVVNIFSKRADRIHLDSKNHEYHVVPDRTRPMDFEVFRVLGVKGHGKTSEEEQQFEPFYASRDRNAGTGEFGYFSSRRTPRTVSSKIKRSGPRSSYLGSEIYVALVDSSETPYRSDLKQLSVQTLCTNRDLPLSMPVGQGRTDFTFETGAPVEAIRCVAGPTKPRPPRYGGDVAWKFLSHLSLNYLSLADTEGKGASALRDLLSLYGEVSAAHIQKQVDGVRSVESKPITRRIPSDGPVAFGRGIEISVTCDESAFEGLGVFLLGAVLDRFFQKYVSLNSFTETVIRTTDRGEVVRWPTRIGQRHIL